MASEAIDEKGMISKLGGVAVSHKAAASESSPINATHLLATLGDDTGKRLAVLILCSSIPYWIGNRISGQLQPAPQLDPYPRTGPISEKSWSEKICEEAQSECYRTDPIAPGTNQQLTRHTDTQDDATAVVVVDRITYGKEEGFFLPLRSNCFDSKFMAAALVLTSCFFCTAFAQQSAASIVETIS